MRQAPPLDGRWEEIVSGEEKDVPVVFDEEKGHWVPTRGGDEIEVDPEEDAFPHLPVAPSRTLSVVATIPAELPQEREVEEVLFDGTVGNVQMFPEGAAVQVDNAKEGSACVVFCPKVNFVVFGVAVRVIERSVFAEGAAEPHFTEIFLVDATEA
jgi:hypothetical protein